MFGKHSVDVDAVAFCSASANVVAQAVVQIAGAGNAFLQNLNANAQVADRVKGRMCAAKSLVFGVVHTCHDLHQALRPDGALRKWVEA